mgnify:CR=1 FL=1
MYHEYENFFRDRLISLRVQKGISAREMSLSLGQNAGYINNIENGRAFPSMSGFFYICDYFHITPQEFFDVQNPAPERIQELVREASHLTPAQLTSILNLIHEMHHH